MPNAQEKMLPIVHHMNQWVVRAQVTPYAQDEMVLIVPRNHMFAKRDAIDKSELRALTFVSLNKSSTVQVSGA